MESYGIWLCVQRWSEAHLVYGQGQLCLWISDFLPYDMPPETLRNVRVFQYNHDTTWQKEAHQTALVGLGNDLMHDIADLLSAPNSVRDPKSRP